MTGMLTGNTGVIKIAKIYKNNVGIAIGL